MFHVRQLMSRRKEELSEEELTRVGERNSFFQRVFVLRHRENRGPTGRQNKAQG
jgi:hypothetical protein